MEKWQRLLLAIYCATSYQKPSKISSGSEKWDIIAWDILCRILAQIGPKLHNFVMRKSDQSYLCQYIAPHHAKCTPSCQNTFKKVCGRLWHVRLNNFEPNWAQIVLLLEKIIFLGKTDWCYYFLPILPH